MIGDIPDRLDSLLLGAAGVLYEISLKQKV